MDKALVLLFDLKEAVKRSQNPIKEIISKYGIPEPVFLDEDDTIEKLINALVRYRRDCVLVKDSEGNLVGIITLMDLLKIFKHEPKRSLLLRVPKGGVESGESPIRNIMSRNPLKLSSEESIMKALELMLKYRISHLVVTEGKSVKAVITKKIILAELLGLDTLKAITPDLGC